MIPAYIYIQLTNILSDIDYVVWFESTGRPPLHHQPPPSAGSLQFAVVFWFCSPWKHHVTSLIVTGACCCIAVPNALGDAIPQGHDLAVPLDEARG